MINIAHLITICEISDFFFVIPRPGCLVLVHVLDLFPAVGLGRILDEDLVRVRGQVDAKLERGAAEGRAAGRVRGARVGAAGGRASGREKDGCE